LHHENEKELKLLKHEHQEFKKKKLDEANKEKEDLNKEKEELNKRLSKEQENLKQIEKLKEEQIEKLKQELGMSEAKLKQSNEKEVKYLAEIEELKKRKEIEHPTPKFTPEQMINIAKQALNNNKPWFGIDVLKEEFEQKEQTGVVVIGVKPSGPAEVAGLKADDVIELINSEPTKFCSDFGTALAKCKPGDVALVQGHRKGNQRFAVRVEIGTKALTYQNIKRAQRIATGTITIGDEEFIVYLMKKQEE